MGIERKQTKSQQRRYFKVVDASGIFMRIAGVTTSGEQVRARARKCLRGRHPLAAQG